MELMNLILLIVLVAIIAVLVVIYLFARKKDKEDRSESKKDKKRSKKEISEKLDELVSKKDDVVYEGIDTETKINRVEVDEETNKLGKELIEEGVMDESVLNEDLAGIDEMFLEDKDEDIEEIKDEVQKEEAERGKKVKKNKGYNEFKISGNSDSSLFKELEKLSTFERRDKFNIMRDLQGRDFDVKDLENELNSVIKEINKVKRKKSKKKR